jgi:hypothetical protein
MGGKSMSENLSDKTLNATSNKLVFKTHSFDVDDAIQFGINAAIILYNIRFWIQKNKLEYETNPKHGIFHVKEGRVWTFNSYPAFQKILPYLSYKEIRNAVEKLVGAGKLITGQFNKLKLDRTFWYSINEDWTKVDEYQETPICPYGHIDLPLGADASASTGTPSAPTGRPIPDINSRYKQTDNKLLNNTYTSIDENHPPDTPQDSTPPKPKRKPPEVVTQEYEVMLLWNKVNETKNNLLPKAMGLNPKRIKAIQESSKSHFKELGEWEAYFGSLYNSEFLLGLTGGNWTASFDWAIKPSSIVKVLEGNYFKSKAQKYSRVEINNSKTFNENPYTAMREANK